MGGASDWHSSFSPSFIKLSSLNCADNFRWYGTIVLSDGYGLPLPCWLFYCVTVDRSVWNYAPNAVSHHRRENLKLRKETLVGNVLHINKCHNLCCACRLYEQYSTGLPLPSRCWILHFVISGNSGRFTVRTSPILTRFLWFCTVLAGEYRDGTS